MKLLSGTPLRVQYHTNPWKGNLYLAPNIINLAQGNKTVKFGVALQLIKNI